MAKKELTYEEAVELTKAATKTRQEASAAKEAYAKEHGLKTKKDHSDDPKHGKAWKALQKVYKAAKAEEEAAKETEKGLKPKVVKSSKYEYPEDVITADDKKKYRAKMRASAKAADKKEAKGEKSDKKASKEEKSDKKAKPSKEEAKAPKEEAKSDKKAKKKAKPSSED